MSGLSKRSVTISGHRTSVSLENEFWSALKEISDGQGVSLQNLIEQIDAARSDEGLSSAIRIHVLRHFMTENVG